jgi:DNA-binding SARP family transcriptional activator
MPQTIRVTLCGGGPAVGDVGRDLQPKCRLALAVLLRHRARDVTRDELIDELWERDLPRRPRAALSTVLTRLRQALAPAGVDLPLGERLRLPIDAEVDVDTAAELVRAGGFAAAVRAVALLDPPFLPGLTSPAIEAWREEVDELRACALDALARGALGRGEPAVAVRAARLLTRAQPYRESAHALLMEALAAAGDVADALRVFAALRARLAAELGAAPGPRITELNARLLRHEPAASLGAVPTAALLAELATRLAAA